jgi:pimeloyl-ACP methyl ester carboxylesterase
VTLRRETLLRDGVALAWYDAGGDGLPVIFQHGLCGDVRQTLEAFPPGPRYRLITLECRGHGASAPGPLHQLSLQTFTDDVAALIEHLGLGPLVVGGISMGAAIATRLAVIRPDLVRALALVRPAWLTDPAPANMAPNAEVGALLARLSPPAALAAFEASPTYRHLASVAPDNLASLLGFFSRSAPQTVAALLQQISADGPGITEPDLAALRLKTLVIGTDRDFVHPLALAQRLAALIPGAHFIEVASKAIDKSRYIADLHKGLGDIFEEV